MTIEVINRNGEWLVCEDDVVVGKYSHRELAVGHAGPEATVIVERRAEVTLEPEEEKKWAPSQTS